MNGRPAKCIEPEVPVDLENLPGMEKSLVCCVLPFIRRHNEWYRKSRPLRSQRIDLWRFVVNKDNGQ